MTHVISPSVGWFKMFSAGVDQHLGGVPLSQTMMAWYFWEADIPDDPPYGDLQVGDRGLMLFGEEKPEEWYSGTLDLTEFAESAYCRDRLMELRAQGVAVQFRYPLDWWLYNPAGQTAHSLVRGETMLIADLEATVVANVPTPSP
jgi:hypothetical protein